MEAKSGKDVGMKNKNRLTTTTKRRAHLLKVVLIVCLLALSLPAVAQAQEPPWPPELCQVGSLGGQQILVCVPPLGWNGNLVVYAHGYVAPQAPIALPAGELGRFPGLIPFLLGEGYAFATTSYTKNGYAVEQAGNDLNALVGYFNTQVAPANKVFITGASEGGLITTMLVERYPNVYAGGLAMCGPINGMPDQIDYLADFRVVFDAFFPQVFEFSAADVPPGAFLSWESEYLPVIAKVLQLHPNKTQELFAMTGAAYVPGDPLSYLTTTEGVLFYSVWGTNDLIATAGGMPYGNQDTWYEGSHNDVALNARVERVAGSDGARGYVGLYYQTSGMLSRPLVTLHNDLDPVVPSWHEDRYAGRVAPSFLFQRVPVAQPYGHCAFSPEEILAAFGTLVFLAGP
jgi:pimeloyl-ACP methyl ester carboxylesterase